MTASILVDTNILVYAYDRAAGAKQQRAVEVLEALAVHSVGAISTQVLAEFFVTITRKLAHPLPLRRLERGLRTTFCRGVSLTYPG
jgi:predicted nucleic acid-binding protein